jgi:hypothetical protein
MGRTLNAILASLLLATAGCSKKPTAPEGIWLGIAPIKCEQTVWEADYSTNPGNYEGINSNEELRIMEKYYKDKSVDILESNKKIIEKPGPGGMPPCPDCGCSRGYLITARVAENDTLALIYDGFSSSLVF